MQLLPVIMGLYEYDVFFAIEYTYYILFVLKRNIYISHGAPLRSSLAVSAIF